MNSGNLPTFPLHRMLADAPGFSENLTRDALDSDESARLGGFLDSLRHWAARNIDDAAIDGEARLTPELLKEAASLGLFGIAIPVEYGGAGFSMKAVCRIIEELAYHSASVAVTVGLHAGLGTRGLIRFGSEDLKRSFLPSLSTGDWIAAFSATEDEAGSDIDALATTAHPDETGALRLDGSKVYVTNGGLAHVFTVVARTPELGGNQRSSSLLLVTGDQPGLTVGREEVKLGIRGSSTTALELANVAVRPDRIIGAPGNGWTMLGEVLAFGRSIMGAGCLGIARRCLAMAAEHAANRRQFGHALGEFGQVAEKLAVMRASLYAMESVLRATTQVMDQSSGDIAWESTALKTFNSEAACRCADDALQLFGGKGYSEETGIARRLRDLRVTRIFEGANEVLRLHLVSLSLRLVKDATVPPQLAPVVEPPLLDLATDFDARVRAVFAAVASFRRPRGTSLLREQWDLKCLADALINLYTLGAVILRTHGEITRHGQNPTLHEQNLCRLLAARLGRDIDAALAARGRSEEVWLVRAIADAELQAVGPDLGAGL